MLLAQQARRTAQHSVDVQKMGDGQTFIFRVHSECFPKLLEDQSLPLTTFYDKS